MHFMELPKGARAKMALTLLVCYIPLADYISSIAALKQPRGLASA